ncbi:MAG: helix-turn-helix domain-containing protein [Bacteroidota bacterium]
MNFLIVQPSPLLRNYIRSYCFMEAGAAEGVVTERVIPVPGLQLMFHYGTPFMVRQAGKPTFTQSRSFLSGLSDTWADVSTRGETGVVFIRFHLAGACHFFNFPLSHAGNLEIDLSNLYRNETRQIEEELYLERSTMGKVKIIEDFLLQCFNPLPERETRLLLAGIRLIRQSGGQITATDLAGRLAVSPRSLERKFSSCLGSSPKQLIRLFRYQEALQNLGRNSDLSFTGQACLNGYFDQSHFIRDFKAFTGYTPKEFTALYPGYNATAEYC